MEEIHKTLTDYISTQVTAGYDDREAIIEGAVDKLYNDYGTMRVRQMAREITDEQFARHYEEQRTWTHETDCDRLDEAFAELDRNGIVARQNFTCCQTCGHSHIGYEIDDAAEHRSIRGYVFFHKQDTELVVKYGNLYLAYGSVDGKEEESIDIGYEVVAALERAGLTVDWNGMIQKRICVRDMQWQRRRVPEAIYE